MKKVTLAVVGVAVVAGLLTTLGSWYTIDQGDRGVLLRNGAVIGTSEPGLHFKLPWVDSVTEISTKQQTTYWTCEPNAKCEASQHGEMNTYSKDTQPAWLRVTVNWHVPDGEITNVYSQYKTLSQLEDQLIARRAPVVVKEVFGQFTAPEVVQSRTKFNADVAKALIADVRGPVVIDNINIENIDFSAEYLASVSGAMNARVAVQKLEQEQKQQEVSAKITVIKAQAEADAAVAEATAKAKAVELAGQAEATAIKAKGDALRANPGLTALILAEKWKGELPTTMVPGSAVPFINVAPQTALETPKQ